MYVHARHSSRGRCRILSCATQIGLLTKPCRSGFSTAMKSAQFTKYGRDIVREALLNKAKTHALGRSAVAQMG